MCDFYKLARPFLFTIAPETAHSITIKALKLGLVPSGKTIRDESLESTVFGLNFPNPVGLAAGFDKQAEVIAPMFKMGFGFVETGTVTPLSQDGNPKPRVFRDPNSEAVINRMGFPGGGMDDYKANIEAFLNSNNRPSGVIGINIGMNKTQTEPAKDYVTLINNLAPMADYLTINISSPNTPGLRDLQKREPLLELLAIVKEEGAKACSDKLPPLLVKLAPDLDQAQQEELADAILKAEIDGIILTNTTLDRPDYLPKNFLGQQGGLSGQPLKKKSTAVIKNFYKLTKGKIPLIGVGGISSGEDAYEKIKAGASLLQLYTALIFKGPGVANAINRELITLLKADGYTNISQAVGVDVKL